MPKVLTLQEVSRKIEGLTAEQSIDDEEIQQFMSAVTTAGNDILTRVGGVEYMDDASTFLLAGVMAELVQNIDLENLAMFNMISKNTKMFQLIMGYALLYAVGLCATEELR